MNVDILIAEVRRFLLSVDAELSVTITSIVYSAALVFRASFPLKLNGICLASPSSDYP